MWDYSINHFFDETQIQHVYAIIKTKPDIENAVIQQEVLATVFDADIAEWLLNKLKEGGYPNES